MVPKSGGRIQSKGGSWAMAAAKTTECTHWRCTNETVTEWCLHTLTAFMRTPTNISAKTGYLLNLTRNPSSDVNKSLPLCMICLCPSKQIKVHLTLTLGSLLLQGDASVLEQQVVLFHGQASMASRALQASIHLRDSGHGAFAVAFRKSRPWCISGGQKFLPAGREAVEAWIFAVWASRYGKVQHDRRHGQLSKIRRLRLGAYSGSKKLFTTMHHLLSTSSGECHIHGSVELTVPSSSVLQLQETGLLGFH